MLSKDIIKQDLKNNLEKAMQSSNPDEIIDVLVDYADNVNDSYVLQEIERERKQSMKVNSIQGCGVKAAKMSKDDFIRAFTGEQKTYETQHKMSFDKFANQLIKKDFTDIKQMTDGSVLAPTSISGDIIFEAAAKSVLLGNSPIVPMTTPTVKIGKITEGLNVDFKEKGAKGTDSDLGLEAITLEAKTLYGYTTISEEDIQDIYQIENVLKKSLSDAVANALDCNFLYTNPKASTKEGIYPKGILNDPGIKKITVDVSDYDMIAKAKLEIAKENGAPDMVALNPIQSFTIQTLKDSNGQYINAPGFYTDLMKIESTRLKDNDGVVYDSNAIVVGIRDQLNIKIYPDLTNATLILRVMIRADVLPVRPNNICKIEIKES